jgi:hypothetical protein
MSDKTVAGIVAGSPEEVTAEWERRALDQRPSMAVCRAMARFWSRMAEEANVATGAGRSAAAGDQARCAESEFENWSQGYLQEKGLHIDELKGVHNYALAAYLAGCASLPRVLVFNAADPETARKLALSVAVCQEVVLLLDAVDRSGLDAVNLSEWSRLRAVSEGWWIECGWTAVHLDAWLADLEGEDLAPGVPARGASLQLAEEDRTVSPAEFLDATGKESGS